MTEMRIHDSMSIGPMLVMEREKLGLSLEDVHQKTKISRKMLHALEEEDVDALPADVYARGFLKSYAALLNLDTSETIQRFDEMKRKRSQEPRAVPVEKEEKEPAEGQKDLRPLVTPESAVAAWTAAAQRKGEGPHSSPEKKAPQRTSSLTKNPRRVSLALVLVLFIVALTLVISYLSNRTTSSTSKSKKPSADETVNFDPTG